MRPSLLSVLCALYASEINVSICISSFWDEGWEVKLGDTVHGFVADKTFANAEEASQFLIHEQSLSCVPWDNAGPFLRFSVTYLAKDETEEDALMAETEKRLGQLGLQF